MSWESRQRLLIRTVNQAFNVVPVIWGNVEGEGLLRKNSMLDMNGEVEVIDAILHNIPTNLFGGLQHGDVLTVKDDVYRVKYDPMVAGDGNYCTIPLSGPILNPSPEIPGQRLTTVEGIPLVAVPEVS
jgi:hypothetical protein